MTARPCRWDPVERSFSADRTYDNPHVETEPRVVFEHESGERHEIPAFFDGGDSFRVRFSPPRAGRWTWRVESDDPGLRESGSFGVTPERGAGQLREHGFLVPRRRTLEHDDGTEFFWLADTVWAAGAKATPGEFREYVDRRAGQGFTVAQLNALPQHDASRPQNRLPFEDWAFDRPNPEYFRTLDRLCAACHHAGIVPAIVALWFNYVPGANEDWDAERHPVGEAAAQRYGRYLGARYGAYGAAWLVAGDTGFTERALAVYDACARGITDAVTHPLRCAHTYGGLVLPEAANDREWIDFHCYQSSHVADLDRPAEGAIAHRGHDPARPVINGEPAYENHVFFDEDRADPIPRIHARRTAWISVLAGATAGVTYGGHGLWPWHRRGESFPATHAGSPDPWHEALSFPAARDYARIPELLDEFGVDRAALDPAQDRLVDPSTRVRAATDGETLLVYHPHAGRLELDRESDTTPEWVHPATGERADADLPGESPWPGDALLVARL